MPRPLILQDEAIAGGLQRDAAGEAKALSFRDLNNFDIVFDPVVSLRRRAGFANYDSDTNNITSGIRQIYATVLENNGVPVACTFLFLAHDVPMLGWTSYLISNPKYKNKDRRELIKLLIKEVEKEAEKHGIIRLYTVCGDKHISDIHKSLEWDMIPVRFEAFKTIQNNIDKLINNNHG